MNKNSFAVFIGTIGLIFSATVHAALFDLTNPSSFGSFGGSNASMTVDGVTLNLIGNGGSLTLTTFDGDSSATPCTGLLYCGSDGVGIRDDEITYSADYVSSSEFLMASFSTPVDITAVHLFDLYGEGDDGTGNPAEVAMLYFDTLGGDYYASLTGTAPPGTLSGYALLTIWSLMLIIFISTHLEVMEHLPTPILLWQQSKQRFLNLEVWPCWR